MEHELKKNIRYNSLTKKQKKKHSHDRNYTVRSSIPHEWTKKYENSISCRGLTLCLQNAQSLYTIRTSRRSSLSSFGWMNDFRWRWTNFLATMMVSWSRHALEMNLWKRREQSVGALAFVRVNFNRKLLSDHSRVWGITPMGNEACNAGQNLWEEVAKDGLGKCWVTGSSAHERVNSSSSSRLNENIRKCKWDSWKSLDIWTANISP